METARIEHGLAQSTAARSLTRRQRKPRRRRSDTSFVEWVEERGDRGVRGLDGGDAVTGSVRAFERSPTFDGEVADRARQVHGRARVRDVGTWPYGGREGGG